MIKRNCKQCGKEFTISDSEIKFFEEKKLKLPKRCSECRKENKNKKNNNTVASNNISSSEKNNTYKNNKKKNILGSVISVALVLVFLVVGKLLNITPNFGDIGITTEDGQSSVSLEFRNESLWEDHFIKHGSEFTYSSKEEYLEGANKVVNSSSSMHKKEAEDGDDIYYDENKNEIVFVSMDGYIRTYFKPAEGIKYYNRQ